MSNEKTAAPDTMPLPSKSDVEGALAELRRHGARVELQVVVHYPEGSSGHRILITPGTAPGPNGGDRASYVAIAGDNEIETSGYSLTAALTRTALINMALCIQASETAHLAQQLAGPNAMASKALGYVAIKVDCVKGTREAGVEVLDAIDAGERRRNAEQGPGVIADGV